MFGHQWFITAESNSAKSNSAKSDATKSDATKSKATKSSSARPVAFAGSASSRLPEMLHQPLSKS